MKSKGVIFRFGVLMQIHIHIHVVHIVRKEGIKWGIRKKKSSSLPVLLSYPVIEISPFSVTSYSNPIMSKISDIEVTVLS